MKLEFVLNGWKLLQDSAVLLTNNPTNVFLPRFVLLTDISKITDYSVLCKNNFEEQHLNVFLKRYSSFLKILCDMQKGMPVKPVKYLTKKHLYPTNFDKINVLRAI